MVPSKVIYDAGYAIPLYDIRTDRRTWRYREETFDLPSADVPMHTIEGIDFMVGRIDDIRLAAANNG